MEEPVLFSEWLNIGVRMGFLSLEGHVCVGDFWDRREVEDNGKKEYEACNCQIHPLDILECAGVIGGFQEENVGAENGSDDGADTVEGLGDVDAEFCIPRRSTH